MQVVARLAPSSAVRAKPPRADVSRTRSLAYLDDMRCCSPSRLVLLSIAAVLLAAPGAAHARGLTLGIAGGPFSDPAAAQPGDPLLQRAVDVGAKLILLSASWSSLAPAQRPADFDPADPADPAYQFSALDAQVRALAARGRTIALLATSAPSWATGAGAPAGVAPGTWRPDPAEFGRFARALATRYDGRFPDPLRPGSVLPAIAAYQPWAEPNLSNHLTPQWTGSGAAVRPASPAHYRRLLNAFYAAVKAVSPKAKVVTAGTAPFGDPVPGGQRMPPARFWREVLCLRGQRLRRAPCADPAHFDALAHHPYSVGGPRRRALNVDDVSVPDLAKLTRPLRRAERTGRALPRKRHPLWVTEFSWDSSPPDPQGVPIQRHARWLAEAFELFWRQGVDTVAWFLLRDEPGPPFNSTYQSGLFTFGGVAKPAARAFRFPLTARRHGSRVAVWARLPVRGTFHVERRVRGTWRSVLSRPGGAGAVRTVSVVVPRGARVRGRVGAVTSISWPT